MMVKLSFRRCLLLCLPALLLGAVVRGMFVAALPEVFDGPDSPSYFYTTLQWWTEHHFFMGDKRRGLYPLLLMVSPLAPGSPAQFVAIVQHLLGLATLVAIGWVTGHVTRRPALWVPVVTCLCAIAPRTLWYEHEMIADSMLLAGFAAAVAVGLPTRELGGRRLFAFLCVAMLIVAIKPHGRPLWLGLVLAAALITRNPLRWGLKNFAVLGVTVAIVFFTGSSRQSGWLFLSSALPLVNTEGKSWREYREALRPALATIRADWKNYPWRQSSFKKPLGKKTEEGAITPAWARLVRDEARYAKATKRLAMEAVLTHPFKYARLIITKLGIALSNDPLLETYFNPKQFWDEQDHENTSRWQKNAKECELVYRRDFAGYQALVTERSARRPPFGMRLFKPAEWLRWIHREKMHGVPFPALRLGWFALLGLLGLVACCLPGRWREGALLVLPCALYLGVIYGVGDAVPRYLLAVDWLLIVFGAIGVDLILDGLRRLMLIARVRWPVSPHRTAT